MSEAKRDQNYVPTLLGVSSVDGTTPIPLWADPTTHRLLVDIPAGTGDMTKAVYDTNDDGTVNSADTAAALTGSQASDITTNNAKVGITPTQASDITTNTAKVTNATHTGDVTGSTALTIANGAVDIVHLSATGTPSATTFLRGDNTWGTPAGGSSTLDEAYDGGGSGVGRTITADSGAVEITVPDTSNNAGLIINQNDVTNDPAGLIINGARQTFVMRDTVGPTQSEITGFVENGNAQLNFVGSPDASINYFAQEGTVFLGFQDKSVGNGGRITSITFEGANAVGTQRIYSDLSVWIVDNTVGTERGSFLIDVLDRAVSSFPQTMLEVGAENDVAINGIGVGFNTAPAIITSRGNQDLTLQTGNATTGTITITDGANGDITLAPNGTGIVKGERKIFQVRLLASDVDQATGTLIGGDYRISPERAITIKAVGAYVDTAGTTGTATIDINEAGTTILSTKITIDTTEKSSKTAATPPVISDTAVAADAIISFDLDGVQGTVAKGLVCWIEYTYA